MVWCIVERPMDRKGFRANIVMGALIVPRHPIALPLWRLIGYVLNRWI